MCRVTQELWKGGFHLGCLELIVRMCDAREREMKGDTSTLSLSRGCDEVVSCAGSCEHGEW